MEENKNVLFNQDDLIEETNNNEGQTNLENGYTEELDFSALKEAPTENVEPEPVPLEPQIEEQPVEPQPEEQVVEPEKEQTEEPVDVGQVYKNNSINENPMGRIKLNKAKETQQEQIDPASIKLDFKGNKNLKYVLVLGLFLFIAVIVIPLFITKFI